MRLFVLTLLVLAAAAQAGRNLVVNGSFEFTADGLPLGWSWSAGKAKGSMQLRTAGGVDGANYVRITNPTPTQAHHFSHLSTAVTVKPDTDYTLTAYLRGAVPGGGFLGGGPGWKTRFGLPGGKQGWTRFGGTFHTAKDQTRFQLMVLTESPTAGFDIDAIQLEEGRERTPFERGVLPGELLVASVPAANAGFGVNLIPNPSFETVDGVRPKHWVWDSRNTKSTFRTVPETHSGEVAIQITNTTPTGPHVYGQLVLLGGLRLTPGESYTLSAYVKSEEPGRAWIGGGEGWWMRIGLRGTEGEWRRVARTFTARNGDTVFPLMINTDSPTKGLLVDDLKLEKGLAATEFNAGEFARTPVHVQLSLADEISCDGMRTEFWSVVNVRPAGAPAPVKATIKSRKGTYSRDMMLATPLAAGTHHLRFTWSPPNEAASHYELALRVGKVTTNHTFELFTPARFQTERATAGSALAKLESALAAADKAQIVCPYAKAARVISRRFLPLAGTKSQKGVTAEAARDAQFLRELCAEQTASVRAALRKERVPARIPDPGLSKTTLRDGNFWVGDEPVMLVGGMGYGELRNALPDYRDYGFNIVGDDFNNGFSCFRNLQSDETFDPQIATRLRQSWEGLAKQNLAVAFNPTLHYFPPWALGKYPDITGGTPVDALPDWSGLNRNRDKRTKRYGAFFPFAIDSPSLRRLVSTYYQGLFPGLRGGGGFQVVWMMNEPTYTNTKDPHYRKLFEDSLKARYKTINRLNRAWSADHKTFAEIADKAAPGTRARYEWLTFHQDQVASWFEWLGREARKHNPELILSNKPMAWTLLHPEQGIDFEREAELWDVPGCDAGRSPGNADYAFGWQKAIMLFDFQKSVAPDKPLGDHEYHYIHESGVSPEYVRATYFHSYLRGLRMSQFWVWATGMIGEGKSGAGMSHTAWQQPRVAWGTATSALDLRRLARYVAPFPGRPEVALYFSKASLYLAGDYAQALSRAHAEANFLDAPIGFATDRMIRAGKLSRYRLLIVPDAEFVDHDVRDAIERFAKDGGRVLLTRKSLRRGHDLVKLSAQGDVPRMKRVDSLDRAALARAIDEAGITPAVRIVSPSKHQVECRSVQVDGKTVFYLLALGKKPVTLRLTSASKPLGSWTDLIAGTKGTGSEFTLAPLAFRMVQLD
jgi:hypothetical protein